MSQTRNRAAGAGALPKRYRRLGGPQSGTYYLKGSSSYGRAGAGRYACRSEAEGAGMREIAN
jgi:hypothetical protein